MMSEIQLFFSFLNGHNPYENLAIENEILLNLPKNSIHLLAWINDPCIVMGRFQNPLTECDLDLMNQDGIKLVRRQSGGGCVYHDRSNLNYSFVASKALHNKDNNHSIIINTLKRFNINSYSTKRVDLYSDDSGSPKKFSGSAFKEKKDSAFHHGTLLFNSDLEKLTRYLRTKDLNIQKSKSIPSNPGKVVNLCSLSDTLNIADFLEALKVEFSTFYKASLKSLNSFDFDKKYAESLESEDWIFFETPKFTVEFRPKGDIKTSLSLTFRKLSLESADFTGCDIHSSLMESFLNRLLNKRFDFKFFSEELEHILLDFSDIYEEWADEFRAWLLELFNFYLSNFNGPHK